MSDNPTEWVVIPLGRPHPADPLAEAVVSVRRADLLAALDMDWYCVNAYRNWELGEGLGICTPDDPHSHPDKREFWCHWAVKP